jgi:hypothetical protein
MAFIYAQKDSGDLKLIGEADTDGMSPALVIDMLLDEETRLKDTEFTVMDENGVHRVTVNGDEPVNPRRDITFETIGGTPAKTTRRKVTIDTSEDEEDAKPARRKPGPKPGSKRTTTAKKTATRRSSTANKLGGKKTGTRKNPLKKNARSSD